MKGNGVSHTPRASQQGIRAKVMDSSHRPLLQSGNHEDAATCKAKPFYQELNCSQNEVTIAIHWLPLHVADGFQFYLQKESLGKVYGTLSRNNSPRITVWCWVLGKGRIQLWNLQLCSSKRSQNIFQLLLGTKMWLP